MKRIFRYFFLVSIAGIPGMAASDFTCSSSNQSWYMCDEENRDALYQYNRDDDGLGDVIQNETQPWLATYDCDPADNPLVHISNFVTFNNSVPVSSDSDPIKCGQRTGRT